MFLKLFRKYLRKKLYRFRLKYSVAFVLNDAFKTGFFDEKPYVKKDVESYLRKLKTSSKVCFNKSIIGNGKGFYFSLPFRNRLGKRLYTLTWDNKKLIYESHRCKETSLNVDNNFVFHSKELLSYKCVNEKIQNGWHEPIIIGLSKHNNSYVILDGNHRFEAAKKLNHSKINAVFLDYNQTYNCLYDDYFKTLYIILSNLNYISFVIKNKCKFRVVDNLNEEGYYFINYTKTV